MTNIKLFQDKKIRPADLKIFDVNNKLPTQPTLELESND